MTAPWRDFEDEDQAQDGPPNLADLLVFGLSVAVFVVIVWTLAGGWTA